MKRCGTRARSAASVLVVALIFGGAEVKAGDPGVEVQAFIETLQSASRGARITALKEITTSGLADRVLFDLINSQLLEGYRIDPENAKGVDEVSWMCKALASSGLSEYKDTLGKVAVEAPSEKIRKYARESLGLVESYSQRNAMLAQQTAETEGLSPEVARLVKMLRAPDAKLKRDAAKKITRSAYKETKLYDVVSEELLAGVKQGPLNKEDEDTLSWLCKALASSGDKNRRTTLEQVYKVTGSDKLKKHAKESLDLVQ